MADFKSSIRGNRAIITCKVSESCYTINRELHLLGYLGKYGFSSCTQKKNDLCYEAESRAMLTSVMKKGFAYGDLYLLLQQMRTLWDSCRINHLSYCRIVFHPDYIAYNENSKKYNFIYYPVNGESLCYHPALFLLNVLEYTQMESSRKHVWENILLAAVDQSVENGWESTLNQLLGRKQTRGTQTSSAIDISGGEEWPTGYDENELPTGNEEDEWPTGNEENYTSPMGNAYEHEPPTNNEDNDEWPTGNNNTGYAIAGTAAARPQDNYYQIVDEPMTGYDQPTQNTWQNPTPSSGKGYPLLIRSSTLEQKSVDKPNFVIGKSQVRANFIVTGNSYISNAHAVIKEERGRYFLIDNDSSNGTYFESRRLYSNDKAELYDGATFQLYNEEFSFHL